MLKQFKGVLLLLLVSSSVMAQQKVQWLRYPAISPDGKNIAFGYKGDIYIVSSSGGVATPLTIHEAHDMMPVWSKDGKTIAFASDRYGNFDVFTIGANGGNVQRITYHSSNDYPYDFNNNSSQIIFGSSRNVSDKNVRFYSPRLFQNLYTVNASGGKPILLSEAGVENAHYNGKNTHIVFQDRKGYEDPWRKRHTSSVTRDIWLLDIKANQYQQLSEFNGEDREPIFSTDDQYVYYLSEKNGSQNIFKKPLRLKIAEQQITQFKNHPVRHLSVANNNTLCYTYDGSIYVQPQGGQAQLLDIEIANDAKQNTEKIVSVNGNISEFSVSPNGKEVAFVTRGEIFVTSIDGGITKRITNTPQQERMVKFSADGKTLVYAAERNESWDIYTATVTRKEEPYFYASTLIKEEPILTTEADEFMPKISPDGKEIAYIENRNILSVYNIATKKTRTLLPKGRNYSYSDGDWDFEWSNDSKYIICNDQEGTWRYGNFAFIKADGSGTIEHPFRSGFGQNNIKWAMNGNAITFTNNKLGRRGLAGNGDREVDIFIGFLESNLYDKFKLTKEELALVDDKKSDSAKTPKESAFTPDIANFENRILRLTINSSSIADYALTNDGSKLYYLSAFEKGYDVWVTDTRTKETKLLAKLGANNASLQLSKDGKILYVRNGGNILKVDDTGKPTPISINSEMQLNTAAERAYIFEHAWQQVKDKFYDPNLHGLDWNMYKQAYAAFLPHISNNYDFQELLSELLGELNGSHTGGRYSPQPHNPDVTASLGLLYDETFAGNGLKITEVIAGGPLDKSSSAVKANQVIEKIDGELITSTTDWAALLNRKVGKNVLLSLYNEATKTRFDEVVKPITFAEETSLMYKRWVEKMRAIVEKLSGGKVGYVHVQGMNDGSYRTVIDEVMGKNRDKQAIIVDTRFNGGGWLHNDLNTLFSGKTYLQFAPQGNLVSAAEPLDRWQKPSCVLMSEGNYSDAFIFPYVYKQNGLGKLIGMPVPGTGTAVWWETQIDPTLVFGIPMIATIGAEKRPTENLQVEPDIKVPLKYEEFLNGVDAQLQAAVKEMLKAIQ